MSRAASAPATLRAAAQAMHDDWLELAANGVEYIADRARESVLPGVAEDFHVGSDALIERLVVPRTVQRTLDVLALISPGLPESVGRLAALLHQPDLILARLAGKACPPIARAKESFVGWAHGDEHWNNVADADVIVRAIAFYSGEYEIIPKLGLSYPALPSELVRPLALCLSGECTFPHASALSTWDVRLRGVPIGALREDTVKAAPRVNPHHLNQGVSYPPGFDDLGATASHRLLRELVVRGWEARFIVGATDPERIVVPGGWRRLSEDLGVRGAAGRDALRFAGALLSLLSVRLRGGVPSRLLDLHVRPNLDSEVRGRTCLDVELLNELVPAVVNRRPKWSDQTLVPFPPFIPPSPATKLTGRACSYQMLLLREMRLRALDFTSDRTIDIPAKIRDRLAYDVGLTKRNRLSIEEAWFSAGPEQFLERDAERIRLAPRYMTLDAFLKEGARRSASGKRRRARHKK